MALQNFVDYIGPKISAAWLNAVDRLRETVFANATTKAAARTALTSDAPLEIGNGGTGVRTLGELEQILQWGGDQTADELAAGVTPTNYAYQPGDLRRYGGVDDGATDNAAAVASLASVATIAGEGFVCRFLGAVGYAVATGVVLPKGVGIEMEVPLIYIGAANETALTIGASGSNNYNVSQRFKLRVRRAAQSDWSSNACIGIRLYSCYSCDITVDECTGFTIGVQCIGAATGFGYNTGRLGDLRNNRYCMKLTNSSSGWCNENVWTGGRFSVDSSVNTSISRFGVWISSEDSSYINNNNNVFVKPSFEMGAASASQEAVAIWIEHGQQNHFENARFENNDLVMRASNASSRNTARSGYTTGSAGNITVEQLDTASENILVLSINPARHAFWNRVIGVDNLGGVAGGTSGVAVRVLGLAFAKSTTATRTTLSDTDVTFDRATGELTIASTRGIGCYVDTSLVKEFLVTRAGTNGGRVFVTAYDSGGVILTGSQVFGAANATLSANSSFGSGYRTGSDSEESIYFRVASGVDHVFVCITGGTASAQISSFGIYSQTYQGQVRAYTGFQETPQPAA